MTTRAPGRGYPPARRLPERRPEGRGAPAVRTHALRRGRRRGLGWLAVLLILLGLFATGLGMGELGGPGLPNPFGDPAGGGGHGSALSRSEPTRLSIPRIQVSAPVQAVGLTDAGAIEVPPLDRHNLVGWYDRGPTPGQYGPAVLVGHVDTRSGPSVFAKLNKLKQGDRILVNRRDKRLAVFQVDAVRSYPKSDIPADLVYGDFTHPGLRLITCGGDWVGGTTGYADNVVVYASLTDT